MKKYLALILSIFIIGSNVASASILLSDIVDESTNQYFNNVGFQLSDWNNILAPEAPINDTDPTSYEVSCDITGEKLTTTKASINMWYDWNGSAWESRGISLSLTYLNAENDEPKVYSDRLHALLNDSFETAKVQSIIYQISLPFLQALHPQLTPLQTEALLQQIIIQMDINEYYPSSSMVSYALINKENSKWNADIDSENPVYDGKKYMLMPMNNGYVLSCRDTEESDTVDMSVVESKANNALSDFPINKNFAWLKLKETMNGIMSTDYIPNSDASQLNIPSMQTENNQSLVVMTGNGVMLSMGDQSTAWILQSSDANIIKNKLKEITTQYFTLNDYAKIGGTEGMGITVYFDTGGKTYTESNIMSLADLMTGVIGEPILLDDSKATLPTESDEQIQTSVLPPVSTVDILSNTEVIVENSEQPVSTSTPEPQVSQIRVTHKIVNFRESPGGKVLFKVERGLIAEIISEVVKEDGWKWYPVIVDGTAGYLRGDCVEEINTVSLTPSPEIIDNVDSAEIGSTINPKVTITPEPAPIVIDETTEYKRGDRNDDIKQLQAKLIDLGYLDDKADGIFGANTENGVKAAQEAWNLTVSGIADSEFISLLYSESALSFLDLEMKNLKPETLSIDTKYIENGAESLISKYNGKEKSGFTSNIVYASADKHYSLTTTVVDPYTSSIETKIQFNDAVGANNIQPIFKLSLMNLYIQDVARVELISGKEVRILTDDEWSYQNGIINIDFTDNIQLAKDFMNAKICDEIKCSSNSTSYSISMEKTKYPYIILKYMYDIWESLDGERIAKASDWMMN